MSEKRKDNKGRILRTGESQRKDLIYQYRYTDIRGKRQTVYSSDLKELRKKEKEIQKQLDDGIDYATGKINVIQLLERYISIKQGVRYNTKVGYTREWINQWLQAIQVRKELTDEWDARGVQKGVEYAILTDEISRAWSGMSTRQYKNLKGLKKENLRDNVTTLELVLNMLAEATTTQFSKDRKPTTFQENLEVAKAGGQVAGRTRKDIESQSNTPVISPKNAAQLNQVVTDLLEGAAADMSEMPEEK